MDGGGGADAHTPADTGAPDTSTPDTGPLVTVGTCETCAMNADCEVGSYCANLVTGGRACLPGCVPDLPECPNTFSCIFDATGTGVDATICAPVGGVCCVDEDGDGYGTGVGCLGEDCNDTDADVHPDTTEICDGIDTNCNTTVDENPNDCASGRCTPDGDGSYSSITGGTCASAECGSGTTSDCGLYTCSEGGAMGTSCAVECAPTGTDDDSYCIETAHCDAGACVDDTPDGNVCDEDGDCTAGHCDNGFCCGTGTCCGGVATDCPGGGGVTRVCEAPIDCQGARGMTECNGTFQCVTVAGIPDDRGCTTTTVARDCGLYLPILCNGQEVQTARACATSCAIDDDCVASAHCEFGVCAPDRPPGGSCSRVQDCQTGNSCADGVCCTTACNGSCEACNLPGFAGTCVLVPSGADPAGECAGYSCGGYYDGFTGGGDVCYRRSDVGDAAAVCNGGGVCTSPDLLCASQPRGAIQVDCNDTCQAPAPGTCTGTIAGACNNLDSPAIRTTCGMGECTRDVQRCVGGAPQTCTPGTPVAETCNGLDDNCNGAPDDGPGGSLCPSAPFAASYTCAAATCTFTCSSGRHDVNGVYADGCECASDGFASSCATATTLGSITTGTSIVRSGTIVGGGEQDWLTVSFPSTVRGPAQGTPQIRLTGPNAGSFVLDFFATCTSAASCGAGGATGVGAYTFTDNQDGTGAYRSNPSAWPQDVVFRVRRVAAAPTSCAAAAYELTISR